MCKNIFIVLIILIIIEQTNKEYFYLNIVLEVYHFTLYLCNFLFNLKVPMCRVIYRFCVLFSKRTTETIRLYNLLNTFLTMFKDNMVLHIVSLYS